VLRSIAIVAAVGLGTAAAPAWAQTAPDWLKPKFGASIEEVAAAIPGTVPTSKKPGLRLDNAELAGAEGTTLFIFAEGALEKTITFFRSGDDDSVSAALSRIYGPGDCTRTDKEIARVTRCFWNTADGYLDLNYLRAGTKVIGFGLTRTPTAPARPAPAVTPAP
jgi:hypothetical protein